MTRRSEAHDYITTHNRIRETAYGAKQTRRASHPPRFCCRIDGMKLALLTGFIAAYLVFQGNDVRVLTSAARALLNGTSLYHVDQFVSPFPAALLFIPFSPLPDALALRAVAFISVTLYVYVIQREARHWWIAVVLMCTPIFLYDLYAANVDWAVFAALLVPPPFAFLLAMVKPQIGLGVALIALLAVWHKNKPLAIGLLVLEAGIFAVSFAAGMDWTKQLHGFRNFSAFPFGVVLGLPLIVLSLKRRDSVMALAAMPFLSPYVGPQSWIAVLPLLARVIQRPISHRPAQHSNATTAQIAASETASTIAVSRLMSRSNRE